MLLFLFLSPDSVRVKIPPWRSMISACELSDIPFPRFQAFHDDFVSVIPRLMPVCQTLIANSANHKHYCYSEEAGLAIARIQRVFLEHAPSWVRSVDGRLWIFPQIHITIAFRTTFIFFQLHVRLEIEQSHTVA